MNKLIKKVFCVVCALLMLTGLTGCISVENDADTELYSREQVALMADSASFGTGKTDDIDVALSYIYNDSDVAQKHGTEFQITGENIVCHYSECETYFLRSVFSGKAKYTITIDDTDYSIELTKEKNGIWQVKEFYESSKEA